MTEREPTPRRGGRPRKPKVIRNSDGTRSVRTTLVIEGEKVRRQLKVGTSDSGVAKARGQRLLAGEAPELVRKKRETFQEVAARVLSRSTLETLQCRQSRLERYAYPVIGAIPVDDITVGDVRDCLDKMREVLGWTGSVRHLKNDISAILGTLYADGSLKENVALRIKFNKKHGLLGDERIQRVVLPRIVLTDDEFVAFLGWGCAEADAAGVHCLPELYLLALSARCLGGMRTSDLHAWRWEHIDTEGWLTAEVPRPKTQGHLDEFGESCLEPYELTGEAEPLVAHLAAWWRRSGKPTMGPVFPVRRGARAGEHKDKGTSYVKQLREALWAAGIVRPQPGYEQAVRKHGQGSEEARKLCALQSGIARRRAALDFHSFRRGWVTATTNVKGLSLQQSMRLSDHSDPTTHAKYMRHGDVRVIPGGVLPLALPKPPGQFSEILHDSQRARKDSNLRPTAPEAAGRVSRRALSRDLKGSSHQGTLGKTTQRQNSLPKLDALREAVDSLLARGETAMAMSLLASQQPSAPAPVVKLTVVRAKRRS